MHFSGLLFAINDNESSGETAAVRDVGGISLLMRQIRQLRDLGITDIILLAPHVSARLSLILEKCRREGSVVHVVTSHQALAQASAGDVVLMIDEALLIDERLLKSFYNHVVQNENHGLTHMSVWPSSHHGAGAEYLDAAHIYGGIAMMPSALLQQAHEWPHDWNAQSACLRLAASQSETTCFDFTQLDSYAPARRRHVPMIWSYIYNEAEARAGDSLLLASAQKGCLDWPARFIHPPIENFLTRLLLPTFITPNMISLLVFLMGLGAAYAFAKGWLWTGLITALVIGPLDGVDGKLARVRTEFSRWGDLEHVGDKIVEYLWYISLAVYFNALWAWAIAALIICFAFAEALQGEFYRRFTRQQLDDTGSIERAFRLISGRRNTFFWTLLPFALFQAWHIGYVTIAVYAVLTFFFMQWRFFVRLAAYGRENSPVINQSFAATAYAFLPERKRSAR